ncbi:hypothetical protein OAB57_00715 [Bacteriovoracaceae bacterium]|nr:hypothetical protein [Bacteriovoracaceae bacterium]
MTHLFIDTSSVLIVGLLSDQYQWVAYNLIEEEKSASKLHYLVYEMCETHNMSINDIESVIAVNGPGSYTGMRVSEGFLQTSKLMGKTIYSFYHFDVPRLLLMDRGVWVTHAFKGEYFLHCWENSKIEQHLVKETAIENELEKYSNIFTQNKKVKRVGEFPNIQYSSDLVRQNPKDIFLGVLRDKMERAPFYFRPDHVEFKTCF